MIYVWKAEGALQFATNLSLPGGFLLASTGNQYCDVTTSTGEYSCLQVRTSRSVTVLGEGPYYYILQCPPCSSNAFTLLNGNGIWAFKHNEIGMLVHKFTKP